MGGQRKYPLEIGLTCTSIYRSNNCTHVDLSSQHVYLEAVQYHGVDTGGSWEQAPPPMPSPRWPGASLISSNTTPLGPQVCTGLST